jgi:SAM-dependent methyltransferase
MPRCLLCGTAAVEEFLDLGRTALANKFLLESELDRPEPMYPLRVGFCRSCSHVQLTEIVPPPLMFEDYLYVSGASDTLRAHLLELSDVVTSRRGLGREDLVIDIGCNDGTLLSGFARHGVRVLGVDPAENLAELAAGRGVDRFVGFFNSKTAAEIVGRWGRAKAITATNTFPHIPELDDFVAGIRAALAPDGVFVIEAHYLVDLLEQGAFDTVYHEHVSYWALGPMIRLFARHGLRIVDVEHLPIHHGQLRVWVQRRDETSVSASVEERLAAERAAGLDRIETYQEFARKIASNKARLTRTLEELKASGRRIVGYGAPAKGNTLLGFLGIGPETVEYIADRSTLKQGRYTPGSHIPVVAPERLLADQPDYVVLLAWNFVDEVLRQQAEYRRRGGRFIIPVPEVSIL